MSKNDFNLISRLRKDLLAAYRDVAPRCWSQAEAWAKTAKHPAPRYYVCPAQAFNMMRLMAVGDFSVVDALKYPLARAKYYSLFDKLKVLSEKREFMGKSLRYICEFLVLQPAPEFFVEPQTVRQMFHYCKRYGENYRYKELHKEYFTKRKK